MNSLETIKTIYDARAGERVYESFASRTPIIGIYDDHEGLNNWDATLPLKRQVKKLFLDFIQEPLDSDRRRDDRGAYWVHWFGKAPNRVAILLLDVRFDRIHGGDLFGDAQMRYLEESLSDSDAQIHFVLSPIQVLGTDKWGQEKVFGESYVRLAKVLRFFFFFSIFQSRLDVHASSSISHDETLL